MTLRLPRAVPVMALLVGLLAPVAAVGAPPELLWIWSGGVTERSAGVTARVSAGARQARLLVWAEGDPDGVRLVPAGDPATPDEDGVLRFEIRPLEPDTLYRYALEIDGRRARETGRFWTFRPGPMSFRVAFGSCATTGSNHRIFETIRSLEPLLFVHMGDFHYENIAEDDPAAFRRAYDEVLGSERQGALYRSVPIAYVWDDHDYGANDADGGSPSRPAALASYQQMVPHYPLTTVDGSVETIQQSFRIGRVHFLLTDGRARRDPVEMPDEPGKSMLGKAQREWLLAELEAAAAGGGIVVWVNPVPWITRSPPGSDHGWEPYGWERGVIADRIEALGLAERLVMLSGDGHMVAIDDGSHSNYATDAAPGERAFPVMHAAPLDRYPRAKGGPYSHGIAMRRRLFGLIKDQQFGLLDLHDDGEVVDVLLSGRDARGGLLRGMELRLRCAPGCRVVPPVEPRTR